MTWKNDGARSSFQNAPVAAGVMLGFAAQPGLCCGENLRLIFRPDVWPKFIGQVWICCGTVTVGKYPQAAQITPPLGGLSAIANVLYCHRKSSEA